MECKRRSSGFTVVELMAGMLSGAVLALLVGTMLVSGYRAWMHNNVAVELHRDGSLAMETIGRLAREAVVGDVVAGGGALAFSSGGGTNVVWQANRLLLNPGGFPLVRGGVFNFQPTVSAIDGTIRVVLQLFDPATGNGTTLVGNYLPRNGGE